MIAKCPLCDASQVIIREKWLETGFFRRGYVCVPCSHRWATIEIPEVLLLELPYLGRRAIQAQAAVDRLVDALRAAGVKTTGEAG